MMYSLTLLTQPTKELKVYGISYNNITEEYSKVWEEENVNLAEVMERRLSELVDTRICAAPIDSSIPVVIKYDYPNNAFCIMENECSDYPFYVEVKSNLWKLINEELRKEEV